MQELRGQELSLSGVQELSGPEVQEARGAARGQEFWSPAVQEDRSF